MKNKYPYLWGLLFGLALSSFTGFVLLKAFVLADVQAVISAETSPSPTSSNDTATTSTGSSTTDTAAIVTDTSYSQNGLEINLTEEEVDDTVVHLVDIQVSDPSQLKTAFAQNSYGRNIKETTATIAEENNAILAINGDFYGFRSSGFVLRNGVSYRDSANGDTEALVIDKNGDFSIVNEAETAMNSLTDAQQILSFGPALVKNSQVAVTEDTEVGQSMSSNPRTAIAQLGTGHYLIIVSEGRTSDSVGLSLYQLAQLFKEKGATTAYNLDGGGSSTLYFNGNVVNQTVGGAQGGTQRAVSDIIYFKA